MRLLFALLQTLTLPKLLALLRVQWAFVMARAFAVDVRPGFMPYVTIEPTNRCNLSCPECITGCGQMKRTIGDMTLEHFKAIVDTIYRHTIVLNLYMQGEPYLNKDLPQMIAYAKEKGIFVSLSTNAQRLPELSVPGLPHHIIISADGATQKSYGAYRKGGFLSHVQAFVQVITNWKKEEKKGLPYIELQFLVNRYNEEEEHAVKALFKGQYNRFVSKTMQIINEENRYKFAPQVTRSKRPVHDVKRLHRGCYKLLSTSVITQDGQAVPCCMDKNAEFAYGNVLESDYKKLLENDYARSFRKMIITKKSKISICHNCPFA